MLPRLSLTPEGFNPPDTQTSYIHIALAFKPGIGDRKSKKYPGFSPIASLIAYLKTVSSLPGPTEIKVTGTSSASSRKVT
jgi:hypothetical protein